VGQPTFNPARTRLTCGLSKPGWVQPTFKKVEFFSTQPGSNSWWAGLAHGLKPILTSLFIRYDLSKISSFHCPPYSSNIKTYNFHLSPLCFPSSIFCFNFLSLCSISSNLFKILTSSPEYVLPISLVMFHNFCDSKGPFFNQKILLQLIISSSEIELLKDLIANLNYLRCWDDVAANIYIVKWTSLVCFLCELGCPGYIFLPLKHVVGVVLVIFTSFIWPSFPFWLLCQSNSPNLPLIWEFSSVIDKFHSLRLAIVAKSPMFH